MRISTVNQAENMLKAEMMILIKNVIRVEKKIYKILNKK